ncbi:MarR family winged helix-turn-helix transcriptional regulator [Allorhizocola rhizosphaerae]|uniref:MarR family winged helix-turn-helix transcriptional regulator n=1 Tax=Allorhizocola rhizosphaerae TaxID=1872709 RepID=UPI000E3B7B29|nr:MarR family winged helix-turn-helix transcriptional regulator [Allorhizocola rhizosphaerae]
MPVAAHLDTDLGWALGVVFRAYVKAARSATDGIPGGHRGFQVLTAAAAETPGPGGRTQRAIAAQLGIDRTVMTYLLDDMERANLIARQADPADRRTRLIVATDHGRAVLAQLCRRLDRLEAHILSGLPDADQATLKGLLQLLASRLNELDPVASTCDVIEDINSEKQFPGTAGRVD